MDHHPPSSDIFNRGRLKLPPEKLTSAPTRAEQDQLKRNKTWIFKVKGPVYTQRTSLKPAALLPLSFFPRVTPGGCRWRRRALIVLLRYSDATCPVFLFIPNGVQLPLPIEKKRKKKSNSLLSAHPGAFPSETATYFSLFPTANGSKRDFYSHQTRTILQHQDSLAGTQSAKSRCSAKAPLWEPLIRRILGGWCVDGEAPRG